MNPCWVSEGMGKQMKGQKPEDETPGIGWTDLALFPGATLGQKAALSHTPCHLNVIQLLTEGFHDILHLFFHPLQQQADVI